MILAQSAYSGITTVLRHRLARLAVAQFCRHKSQNKIK